MIGFRIEPLGKHDRRSFECGSPELESYFKTKVSQDIRRRFAACYVIVSIETGRVAGFYTLSSGSVSIRDLPEMLAKKLPRYPSVPVVRVGRLAIATEYHGQKLGGLLLIDAIRRAIASEIAAYAVVVDAKDENAILFYEHYGFTKFESMPNTLYLPLQQALIDLLGQRR